MSGVSCRDDGSRQFPGSARRSGADSSGAANNSLTIRRSSSALIGLLAMRSRLSRRISLAAADVSPVIS